MRIGIDVGGTNTDAVLMDGSTVLAGIKQNTMEDVTEGIIAALSALQNKRSFDPSEINAIMVGTTHFINALVEARQLAPTAAIRLGLPATASLPPFVGWPDRLVEAVKGRSYLAHGGHEFDGRLISPIDKDELRRAASDMSEHGVQSVAISSVFSPINDELEQAAKEVIRGELGPEVSISLSSEIGRMGLLERENATIINAALRELADSIIGGLTKRLATSGYNCNLYLSQNDGTLMDVEDARRYPVATFASGPTNSMRGAAVTSGLSTCAVVDVGGTTSDVGVLTNGFPREATTEVTVAGIRTNFRMPDVLSIGIGGGSLVNGAEVGPESVGYQLNPKALVFGGSTLTATDIAVASGRAEIGDPDKVAHLETSMVNAVLERISERIADTVDRMRTTPDPLPVVAVGGGAFLLPDSLGELGEVLRPENAGVANAIGATIAQVSGEIDRVYSIKDGQRDSVIEEAQEEARVRAIEAGATPGSVSIVEFDEVPIPYLPGNSTRVRVKAVGDLPVEGTK